MSRPRPGVASRVLASMAQSTRPARVIAQQLDALRTLGPNAWSKSVRAARGDQAELLSRGQSQVYKQIWEHAAGATGASLQELAGGYLIARRDAAETLLWRHLVMLDHPANVALALDKPTVHQLLRAQGLPIPDHLEVEHRDRGAALEFLAAGTDECVVKPANASGGLGVTCGVQSADDLARAWVQAARWGSRVLVERQTSGEEYRLLFLDGRLLGAVNRGRPCVTGDGHSSVLALVRAENDRRLASHGEDVSRVLQVDLDCELAVRRSGFSLRSVIPEGLRVKVKSTVGENARAENLAVPVEEISPQLVAEAAHAAKLVRLRLAGIDLMTPDRSRSLREAGGTILEVNATPGLHYHYQVANPEQAPGVAEAILRELLGAPGRS
jgi:D-alanine-D-alanine ligase-like ATP-grasp enzyme